MGTGTTDIIDSCVAMNLKTPEFYQDDDFRTILWRTEYIDNENNTDVDVSQNDSQNDSQKLGKRQQNILQLIDDNSSITARELAQKLKVSVPTIYRDLKSLQIRWSGPSKNGHWEHKKY